MRIVVIVASTGRAELLGQMLNWLAQQDRKPDRVIVSAVTAADVAGITAEGCEIIFAERGLPRQRNAALHHLDGDADIVVFFDDDFVAAPDYLASLEAMFTARPQLVGATGRLIADGIKSPGISFADAILAIGKHRPPQIIQERSLPALYGCNLCVRLEATKGIWFDESLPLYGWQEDVDYSYQVGRNGTLVYSNQLTGVHLGAKGGRTSGKRLGYSQIANPVYLLRKQTIPPRLAWRLMWRNLAANVLRSPWPESYIDRRGRLSGNFMALIDLVRGRIHPERIMKF